MTAAARWPARKLPANKQSERPTEIGQIEPVPNTQPAPGCGYDNTVRISRTSVALSSPFTLSCPAAVSLALWERHVLRISAQSHQQRAVTRIDHLGTYACRNIYGCAEGPRSRHASADAIDVAGVVLDGGCRQRWRKGALSACGTRRRLSILRRRAETGLQHCARRPIASQAARCSRLPIVP